MALPPLATAADLAARLKVETPAVGTDQRTQWDAALADASGHLRDAIGSAVTQLTSTVTLPVVEHGLLELPGGPATSVGDVSVDGAAPLPEADRWLSDARTLRLSAWRGQSVRVTYTHGWVEVPAELVKWTCVLAAAQLASAARGSLGMAGNVASVAVDDARVQFRADGDEPGVELPERVAVRLRATYGAGGVTAVGHR